MGLSDIHLHLDGSLRRQTVEAFAREDGVTLPPQLLFAPGMGLDRALACFGFTLRLLRTPARVAQVAHEICEDASHHGVSTLEIRFAPQLHGDHPAHFVDAAIEGCAGRAGIILCTLYGEPPEVSEGLVDLAATRKAVVGIDLAGGPVPGLDCRMQLYADAFARARRLEIGRTVHAGEGRPPAEIRDAIEVLHAQRIGHGTSLLDDPRVVELVRERGVTLEACPTSNVHTGAIAQVEDHPIGTWLQMGLKACINTDNTFFSDVDAPREYERALLSRGMTPALLQQATEYGHAARFTR